jgi:hypothetical protein
MGLESGGGAVSIDDPEMQLKELAIAHYQPESLIGALILILITKPVSTLDELLLILLHHLQANQNIGPCLSLHTNLIINQIHKQATIHEANTKEIVTDK